MNLKIEKSLARPSELLVKLSPKGEKREEPIPLRRCIFCQLLSWGRAHHPNPLLWQPWERIPIVLTWWRSPKEITPSCVGECTVYGKQGRRAVLRHCSSICSSSGLQRVWDHLRPHVLGDALAQVSFWFSPLFPMCWRMEPHSDHCLCQG